eukprot:ANDGO_01948.mRNA.1 hypothetical protein
MAEDTTLEQVRNLLFILYLLIGSIAFVFGFLSIVLREKRSATLFGFFAIAVVQCSVRAFLFHVPSQFYLDVMTDHGIPTMMVLDLIPEVLFLTCYIMFLSTWIEVHFCVRTMRKYSHLRAIAFFAFLFTLLLLATVSFTLIMTSKIPSGKLHSWTYYGDYIVDPEGNFITAASGVILLLFVVSGLSLIQRVGQAQIHERALRILRTRIVVLSVFCTISFVIRGVYVHTLDSDFTEWRKNGKISEKQYDWLFFSYFALTEILFQLIMLGVLGGGLPLFCFSKYCSPRSKERRTNRVLRDLDVIPNPQNSSMQVSLLDSPSRIGSDTSSMFSRN